MREFKNSCLLIAAAIALGLCAAYTQKRLDKIHPKRGFEELMYLPSGKALEIAALGFESPLADAIWLKTLIYFSANIKGQDRGFREARHLYLKKAMEVVTRLNPRFRTAYTQGGLLLSAAGKPKDALYMLEKGVREFPDDWRFHIHIAIIAMQQLNDHDLAYKHFKGAANCPDVPESILEALPGILGMKAGEDSPPDKIYTLQIVGLEDTVSDKSTSPQLRNFSLEKLKLLKTKRLCYWMTKGVERFKEKTGRAPVGLPDLFRAGVMPVAAETDVRKFPFYSGDQYVLRPDGTVTTKELVKSQVNYDKQRFANAVRAFRDKKGRNPTGFEEMLKSGEMLAVPQHPLKGYGFTYDYDEELGELKVLRLQ